MKKTNYECFENEYLELLKTPKDNIIVKDKRNNKFLFAKSENFKGEDISWKCRYSKVSSYNFTVYVIVFISVFLINIFLLYRSATGNIVTEDKRLFSVTASIIYICISCIFHELGHINMMRFFGRKSGKIKFKFNYLFPSAFVNINEAYLLTKAEKIMVHTAGIFVNLIFNSIIFSVLIFTRVKFLQIIYLGILSISWSIVYNLIPFLNSDGYKLLLCLLDKNEFKQKNKNYVIVRFIKVINIIFSILYLTIAINDIVSKVFEIDLTNIIEEVL